MRMRGQASFFDVEARLEQLSAKVDELERLTAVVDFELFRRIGASGAAFARRNTPF
jgi:hypothetical protein